MLSPKVRRRNLEKRLIRCAATPFVNQYTTSQRCHQHCTGFDKTWYRKYCQGIGEVLTSVTILSVVFWVVTDHMASQTRRPQSTLLREIITEATSCNVTDK
jgi:hypothetical protein